MERLLNAMLVAAIFVAIVGGVLMSVSTLLDIQRNIERRQEQQEFRRRLDAINRQYPGK